MPKKAKPTDKQRLFIEYYLQTMNATEAARRAGYKHPRQMGSENLSKPVIRAEIDQRLQSVAMQADEVLARISDIARADLGDYIKVEHGLGFLDLEKARDAGLLRLVKKFKITKAGIEFELHDVQTALTTLAKHHNLLQGEENRAEIVITVRREEVGLVGNAGSNRVIALPDRRASGDR